MCVLKCSSLVLTNSLGDAEKPGVTGHHCIQQQYDKQYISKLKHWFAKTANVFTIVALQCTEF